MFFFRWNVVGQFVFGPPVNEIQGNLKTFYFISKNTNGVPLSLIITKYHLKSALFQLMIYFLLEYSKLGPYNLRRKYFILFYDDYKEELNSGI